MWRTTCRGTRSWLRWLVRNSRRQTAWYWHVDQSYARDGLLLDWTRIKIIFPPVLSSWRTLVQTKWRKWNSMSRDNDVVGHFWFRWTHYSISLRDIDPTCYWIWAGWHVKSVSWYRPQSVTNTILTELLTPLSCNIHAFISEKARDEPRGSNVETIQTLVGFAEKARTNTLAAEKLEQVHVTRTSLPLKITTPIKHPTIQLTWKWRRGRSSGRWWWGKRHVFFVCCSRWCHRFRGSWIGRDCSSCRHVGQWSWPWRECATGTGERTSKVNAKARAIVDGDWKNWKRKTECRSCGREGHWAHDRECAVSSSGSSTQNQTRTPRMATRQHLSNRANQDGVCFVLNDNSDHPDTSACMVAQNVLLPTESVKQTLLTPINAVDMKKGCIFVVMP